MSKIVESTIVIIFLCLICCYGMKVKKSHSLESYLSKETTTDIRGLLALGIVLHHASCYYTVLTFVSVLRHVGYLIVALFFFLSGYGVQYGFENKDKYMTVFLKNRLCAILIPYWIANTVEIILLTIFGKDFSVKAYILSLLLIKLNNGSMWYIQVLIMLYFIYWISHVKSENMWIFWLALCALLITFFCTKTQDLYYKSILAFPLGVYSYKYRQKLLKSIERAYIRCLSICVVGMAICLFIKFFGTIHSFNLITEIGNISSAVMICICLAVLLYKLQMGNTFLRFLGNLSFEIYLIHYCCLNIVWRYDYAKESMLFFFIVSLGFTVVLSMALNQINKIVLSRTLKYICFCSF